MQKPTLTISWTDEMSVGIPEVDKDHKHSILLINEFNRSVTDGKSPEEIRQRLQLIVDDTVRHFIREEKLFEEWQYPEIDGHAKIHLQVLNELEDIMRKFVPYGYDTGWVDAGMKIKSILINHIMTEDMKYSEYYRRSTPEGNIRPTNGA